MLIGIIRLDNKNATELYRRAEYRHVMKFQQAIHFRLFLELSSSPLDTDWDVH